MTKGSAEPNIARKHFHIDEHLSRKLKIYAATHDFTQKDIVEQALEEFFKKRGIST